MDKIKEQLLLAVQSRKMEPLPAMEEYICEISKEIAHGRITTDQAREQIQSFRQSAFALAIGKFNYMEVVT